MKLRSKVVWMSCLAYLEQGAPWHSSNFEVKLQSIQICGVTKTQVMRNQKTFFVITISLIWRLSTRNYRICNETIDKNANSERTKAVRSQIFTNTVTHLIAAFSGDQMSMISDWRWPFFGVFYNLMLVYHQTIIVPCCSGTWVIYTYVDNGSCLGKICPSVIKINKSWGVGWSW